MSIKSLSFGTYRYGLIGKQATIVNSSNLSLKGKKGIIHDETKWTLLIGEARVLKHTVDIQLGTGSFLNGKNICKRTEERIK